MAEPPLEANEEEDDAYLCQVCRKREISECSTCDLHLCPGCMRENVCNVLVEGTGGLIHVYDCAFCLGHHCTTHCNPMLFALLAMDIAIPGMCAVPTEGHNHSGAQDVYHEWRSGQRKWHVCALIRPPYTCAQCNCKRYLWCIHCGGCAFCLTTTGCPARGGITRDTNRWVHHRAHQEPTMPPIVAHGNGSNTAPVVRTPIRPKKQRKVHSRADTSMPTTTRTTRSGRPNKPPPPTDGGYLFEGDSTPKKRHTKNDPTPRRRLEGTGLQAWVDDLHICAYQGVAWERCSSQGPGQRPWLGVITSSNMWTSVIARCHPNHIGGTDRFFFHE